MGPVERAARDRAKTAGIPVRLRNVTGVYGGLPHQALRGWPGDQVINGTRVTGQPDRHTGMATYHELGHSLMAGHDRDFFITAAQRIGARGRLCRMREEFSAWCRGWEMARADGFRITNADREMAAACLKTYGVTQGDLAGWEDPVGSQRDNRLVALLPVGGTAPTVKPLFVPPPIPPLRPADRPQPVVRPTRIPGGRVIKAKFPGKCADCGGKVEVGHVVAWYGRGRVYHRRPGCDR